MIPQGVNGFQQQRGSNDDVYARMFPRSYSSFMDASADAHSFTHTEMSFVCQGCSPRPAFSITTA